jgi:hypothetical protein
MVLVAGPLSAQEPRPISLDLTIGGGAGLGGGELDERGGVALDAILAGQLRGANARFPMIGLAVGVQSSLAFGDKCRLGSNGQCVPEFPALASIAVLAGREFRQHAGASPGATLRLLAGPAYVHVDGHSAGKRHNTVGIQSRADLATAPLGPVSMLVSLRGMLIPRVRDQTLGAWAMGVGLRLR